MIKIFFPKQYVPEWLNKQTAQKGFEKHYKAAEVKFESVVLVWAWRGSYRVVNVLPTNVHMSVIGGEYAIVQGQSPAGGKGRVMHYRSLFSALGL